MSASETIQPNTPARSGLNARLAQIAAVAGVPIEAFFSESAPAPQSGLVELIRLWDSAATETMRAEILAGTRAVVAGTNGRSR
ncbi:hypothetical protein MKL09_17180 [Methylobacterium sp. J-048]|uniref:hypothetical protein n=1 Tax=Methylobacterium sp. J-048 TaxID=2836635 RepID=UPI001FB88E9A|nr:hypothetical protein [Methylobacterium sp. J-048]MCJ2058277.1 hypothetical protein [Methylobacterium sp. J-048]